MVAKPAEAVPVVNAKSIAVLPFANFSPDKDNEFFADGPAGRGDHGAREDPTT
jgi:TolB-like protein